MIPAPLPGETEQDSDRDEARRQRAYAETRAALHEDVPWLAYDDPNPEVSDDAGSQ